MATVRHLGLFPFCVGTYPPRSYVNEQILLKQTGELTDYPFQLPLFFCTRMWWTVKHWRVSFDYYQFRDLSDEYDPGDYTLIDQSISVTTSDESLPGYADYVKRIESGLYGIDTSERQLVVVGCGNDPEEAARQTAWNVPLNREFLVDGESGSQTINRQLYFFTNWDRQQLGFAPPFVVSENQNDKTNLWSAMSFGFGVWESWGDEDEQDPNSDPDAQLGQGVFSLLGLERTFTIQNISIGGDGGVPTTETLTNLRIEPSEFWEYDPGDGLGPIYDKTTGRQLRAFPDSSASAFAFAS